MFFTRREETSIPSFITKALCIRPALSSSLLSASSPLTFQLVQAIHFDGDPICLPTNYQNRWKDEPYAVINSDIEENNKELCFANICLFGVTSIGNSVMTLVEGYRPYVRVELNPGACTANDAEALRSKISSDYRIKKESPNVTIEIENLKRFYGWLPDSSGNGETKKFKYAKLRFDNWKAAQTATYVLEKMGYSVTDKNVKPLCKFMNDLELVPSDWIICNNFKILDNKLQRISNCQLEITTTTQCIKPAHDDAIAPLLVASFDCEMYSSDGSFPNPLKGDYVNFIGASFWKYGDKFHELTRFVLCLGSIDQPKQEEGLIVVSFQSKKELIEGFRDLIVAADPDIVTGWNTYGFDYLFLHEDYKQNFLPPSLRGSEDLQIEAIHMTRKVNNFQPSIINSAPALLAKVREKCGNNFVKDWMEKNEKKFGSKNIKILQKLEKLIVPLSKPSSDSSSLSAYAAADLLDDNNSQASENGEEEDEVQGTKKFSSMLAATVAQDMRVSLKAILMKNDGKCDESASRKTKSVFEELLNENNAEKLISFWKNIQSNCGANAEMLLKEKTFSNSSSRGLYLGRLAAQKSDLVEKRMTSAARGDNTYYFWNMIGRINIDLMQVIKDDKKPEDNTLKFAAIHWLGGGSDNEKIELSANEMFAAFASGDLSKRLDIARYCSRDCDIPIKLIQKMSYIPTWVEMSRVTFTWTHDVINSGQQVKVFNLISRFVRGQYALNIADSGWPKSADDDDIGMDSDALKKRKPDYQGATVIEPIAGFYEDCISTLDFESLYPSIIRYFNLCPSVLILDPKLKSNTKEELFKQNIEIESHEIQHNILLKGGIYKNEARTYSFATHTQGVLPKLLKRLLDARKSVKREMAACEDPAQKAILNGRQNGIKVACNSVYGFCGVSLDRGLLPCKPVAAVTTLKGRAFIDAAKSYVESNYKGSKVIYGDTDSVMIFWGKDISVEKAAAMGKEASYQITQLLRTGKLEGIGGAGQILDSNTSSHISEACSAVSLAYEKTYRPYLLLRKKNYAGLKYTENAKGEFHKEVDMKGIDAIRRDRPKFLRTISNEILDVLLLERSPEKALETLHSYLINIAAGKLSLDNFILSKSLKSSYVNNNLPHVTAWKRMSERGDEGLPPIGSRMPFIVIDLPNSQKLKLYEKTEHPQHVKNKNLQIDKLYYLESLKNPITKLLQYVVPMETLKNIFKAAKDSAKFKSSNTAKLFDLEMGDKCLSVFNEHKTEKLLQNTKRKASEALLRPSQQKSKKIGATSQMSLTSFL
jgi:DNA polymerase elongation subunit (family B)